MQIEDGVKSTNFAVKEKVLDWDVSDPENTESNLGGYCI